MKLRRLQITIPGLEMILIGGRWHHCVEVAFKSSEKRNGFSLFKQRKELLNRKIFATLIEVEILIEQWRSEYNQIYPHSSLGYQPSAPGVRIPIALT
jgi:hypothetical protein